MRLQGNALVWRSPRGSIEELAENSFLLMLFVPPFLPDATLKHCIGCIAADFASSSLKDVSRG